MHVYVQVGTPLCHRLSQSSYTGVYVYCMRILTTGKKDAFTCMSFYILHVCMHVCYATFINSIQLRM